MDTHTPLFWPRRFLLLAVASAAVGVFFGVQLTIFTNFAVERLAITPSGLGNLEALRELPGVVNVLIVNLLLRIAPPVLGGMFLVVMGAGLALLPLSGSITALTLFSLVWSVGFHCWLPLQQAMALSFSPAGDKGVWLGRLRSVESLAWLVAAGVCFLVQARLDYGGMFVMAGATTILGGLVLLLAGGERPAGQVRPRLLFGRAYARYYVLSALQGCRKQIFVTFAALVLVKVFAVPVRDMILLVIANQVLSMVAGPLMGRLVDRYGERITLSASHVLLALVFCGYALVRDVRFLYVLFCLDSLLFVGGIALTTWLHRIAPPGDVQPGLAMGVAMNHVAAVLAPFAGGLAWEAFGYPCVFWAGAAVALASVLVSLGIKPGPGTAPPGRGGPG